MKPMRFKTRQFRRLLGLFAGGALLVSCASAPNKHESLIIPEQFDVYAKDHTVANESFPQGTKKYCPPSTHSKGSQGGTSPVIPTPRKAARTVFRGTFLWWAKFEWQGATGAAYFNPKAMKTKTSVPNPHSRTCAIRHFRFASGSVGLVATPKNGLATHESALH